MSEVNLPAATGVTIYSIGHSNHSMEAFLTILERHAIQSLVDVRSAPYSRHVSHFNRSELEDAVTRCKIRYIYLGDELGGRPRGSEFYDHEGYVLYYRAAKASYFLHGLDKLIEEAHMYRAAIMCSEENPTNCHRRLLVARVLEERGTSVVHIRADGREQIETDFHADSEQLSLWDAFVTEKREDSEWKSILPVSPRRVPSSSSNLSDDWRLSNL